MSKKPIILGIESSCDETAASIITENEQGVPTILSSIVSSQVDIHKEFGGVVPELAARSHIEKIDSITKNAIDESGIKMEEIDAVASTAFFMIKSIFSICDLAASSGTTPPKSLWTST